MSSKKHKVFDDFAEDLLIERSARPLLIIGAAKVDDLLFLILERYLVAKIANSKDSDELLEGDRPLSTFSSRIKITYRLGLIDKSLYYVLDQLRKLRNIGAHSLSFNTTRSPIREHIGELRKHLTNRDSYKLTKQCYFGDAELTVIEELQCLLLVVCVLLEAVRIKVRRTRTGASIRKISSK